MLVHCGLLTMWHAVNTGQQCAWRDTFDVMGASCTVGAWLRGVELMHYCASYLSVATVAVPL